MTALVCTERLHEALKADPIAWAKLERIGIIPAFKVDAEALELRACAACHSTLCKPITVGDGGAP